jgi:hypothetical protein
MSASVLHRIERAYAAATARYGPLVTPSAVELFTAAFGEPDPWQQAVLQSDAPRLALNITRQGGKSSVAAAKATHAALSTPGALVLVVSPSLRQSGELFRKIMDVYGAAGRPVPPESETKLTLDLANGSRVVSLPGKEGTIRGYSGVSLLLIDEASRVPDELYYSVRPMLAVSAGRLATLSTPFGKRGWWHKEWTEGGEGWRRFEVPATDCPRISAAFLEEERRSMGALFFASEYECRFVETVDQVFSHELVMAAVSDDVRPLFEEAVA